MKKTTYTVTRFDIKDEFYVEVTPSDADEGFIDFILGNKEYGIKELMYGVAIKDILSVEWEHLIDETVDAYIEKYKKRNFNEE